MSAPGEPAVSTPKVMPTSTPEMSPVPSSERDRPNTPVIRQQVLGRDGRKCAVPGCPGEGRLYAHQVQWKSHGGRTHIDNEISVCERCHSLIHEGLLRVSDRAPHGLRWSGPKGEALLGFDRQPQGRQVYEVRAPRGASTAGASRLRELPGEIHSLDEIPDEIDTAWWRKYGHNFVIKGERLVLRSP